MKKRNLRITPFLLLCAIAVIAMLYFLIAERNSPAEVRYTYLVLLLPVVLGMAVADVIFRLTIKKQALLWIVETVLLLGLVYYWIVSD